MSWLRRKSNKTLPLVCLACTMAVAGLYSAGVFALRKEKVYPLQKGEFAARDLIVRHGRTVPPSNDVVFLAIDAQSTSLDVIGEEEVAASPALQRMKTGWPWPRDVYPLIIDRLVNAGARVVAFDLMFPTPREGDDAFREGLDRFRERVVIGSNFTSADREKPSFSGEFVTHTMPTDTLIRQSAPLDPRVAFVNFWPDADGVIRRAVYRITAETVMGVPASAGDEVIDSLAAKTLRKAGLSGVIPDGTGQRLLRFSGPPGTFVPRSIYEIFVARSWGESADYGSGRFFNDKIVLVGPEGNWSKDYVGTPFGTIAGPEMHLQAINAAMHGQFLRETPWPVDLALILAGGLAAFVLGRWVQQPALRFGALIAAAAAYCAFALALYNHADLHVVVISPLVAMTSSGVVWLVWEQVLERVERARTRRTLERYVSKNVVRDILDNPATFLDKLGGVRQSVVIMFTDLRGFTTLTERADSAQLVGQLNEYFSEMVKVVFETGGTLDKFLGDGLMAVWGNVHTRGPAGDVEAAVTAALHMRQRMSELNARWKSREMETLTMGAGINFGEVIVGNIGSSEKMELTVIGDAVNLASRIEALTKQYGANLLLGESAAALVRDAFHLQLVDFVQVKGKTRPIDVYSVLGRRGEPLDPATQTYLEEYETALHVYRAGRFETAAEGFARCLEIIPGDFLAGLYHERCRELIAEPPPSEWDGVFVMTRK